MSNFFKNIHSLNVSDLKLTIARIDGQLTVSVLQKIDDKLESLSEIAPLILTGTPEELDEKFFEIISKPIQAVEQLIDSTNELMKQIEEAKKENEKKSKSTSTKDEVKETAEEKAIKILLAKISKIYPSPDFDLKKQSKKVIDLCNQILEKDSENQEALKIISELKSKENEGSILGEIKEISNEAVIQSENVGEIPNEPVVQSEKIEEISNENNTSEEILNIEFKEENIISTESAENNDENLTEEIPVIKPDFSQKSEEVIDVRNEQIEETVENVKPAENNTKLNALESLGSALFEDINDL